MAAQKPGIPSGTRDFSHEEMIRRTYIFDTIRRVFQTCGFMPIETPAMENLTTLMGKYGEEGDKLLFKVLNSGDFMSKVPAGEVDSLRMAAMISEKGLRYDLTVPFARYVVQHQGELTFPFKRYQIQPVWRADRPQKGRYREFYQCDVDVIGSRSLINEVELIGIVEKVFEALKVGVKLKLNNRKILFGIAQTIGHAEKMTDITTAIDKLEKIGIAKVNEELAAKGIDRAALDTLQPILSLSGTNREKLEQLESVLAGSETGMKGICEMRAIFDYTDALGIRLDMELDLSLARGLNYYTGAIFEVKALDFEIGSICGGGRYDDLTGIFGLPDMSGVGISFGADRIYDVLSGLNLFPADTVATTGAMFLNFGGEAELTSLRLLRTLRESGVSSEIYPENAKIKKQMDYANKKNIPFVIIIGDNELEAQSATLKNMNSGEQTSVALKELAGYFV